MVRVGTPSAVARPAWYDRNPTPRTDYYIGGTVAPHAATTRLTYTCPSGKKAMIEILSLFIIRDGAPTTAGYVTAYFNLTPSGQALKTILYIAIRDATVGTREHIQPGTTITLFPGDVLVGGTYDGSTGGTMNYHLSYKITEFDA